MLASVDRTQFRGIRLYFAARLAALVDPIVDAVNDLVDGVTAGTWKPVRVITAAALPANTYDDETQIKMASGNGLLNDTGIDGVVTLAVGDRVWDKDAATGSERGLFEILTLGGISSAWSMRRTVDGNTSEMYFDGKVFTVGEGTVGAGKSYQFTNDAAFTLDTSTPVVAREVGAVLVDNAQTITALKSFATLMLAVWNAGATFATKFASNATATRTATLPDESGILALETVLTADPGTGQAIPVVLHHQHVSLTIGAGVETNTVANPPTIDHTLSIVSSVQGAGTRTITFAARMNKANNTTFAAAALGDYGYWRAVSIAGNLRWELVNKDGGTLG